ncbi:MAG: MazG family protein [Frankiales bacterium]|nr:MazG family protein [Frankiales bacterium]
MAKPAEPARSTGNTRSVEPTEPAGSALLRAVAVMDRLRSPGGCPWDAEQTHASLAKYLLEETYETLDAIEDADAVALREELGDLLLQVLFHARLAEEAVAGERFSIEDVAGDLVDKLVRRHPHVFSDTAVSGAGEVNANWEVIKQQEKQRTSVTDGVPLGQPALALSAKLIGRAQRAGLAPPPHEPDVTTDATGRVNVAGSLNPAGPVNLAEPVNPADQLNVAEVEFGEKLFALALEAVHAGVDPELALRATARRFADALHAEEQARARTEESTDTGSN